MIGLHLLLTSSDGVLMTKASHPARAKTIWAQLVRSSHGVLTKKNRRMLSAVTLNSRHQWSPGPSWVGRRASTSSAFDRQHPGYRFAASGYHRIPGYLAIGPLNIVLLLFQALPPQFPLEPAAPALVLEASSVRTLRVVQRALICTAKKARSQTIVFHYLIELCYSLRQVIWAMQMLSLWRHPLSRSEPNRD